MKTLNQVKTVLLASIMALALSMLVAGAEGKEKEIKLADCPTAVQQTIQANAGGGQITEVEMVTQKDGTVVYEAEVKMADGKEVELEVAADGKLIAREADGDEEED